MCTPGVLRLGPTVALSQTRSPPSGGGDSDQQKEAPVCARPGGRLARGRVWQPS